MLRFSHCLSPVRRETESVLCSRDKPRKAMNSTKTECSPLLQQHLCYSWRVEWLQTEKKRDITWTAELAMVQVTTQHLNPPKDIQAFCNVPQAEPMTGKPRAATSSEPPACPERPGPRTPQLVPEQLGWPRHPQPPWSHRIGLVLRDP